MGLGRFLALYPRTAVRPGLGRVRAQAGASAPRHLARPCVTSHAPLRRPPPAPPVPASSLRLLGSSPPGKDLHPPRVHLLHDGAAGLGPRGLLGNPALGLRQKPWTCVRLVAGPAPHADRQSWSPLCRPHTCLRPRHPVSAPGSRTLCSPGSGGLQHTPGCARKHSGVQLTALASTPTSAGYGWPGSHQGSVCVCTPCGYA